MEQDARTLSSRPSSGGVIRLRARLTDLNIWLGPTWASLCGVVASGSFGGQGEDWTRLALLVLLVDGGWGTLWAALGNTDWATPVRRWRTWRSGGRSSTLPYTLPGTLADRGSRWLGHVRVWWRDELWPRCGRAVSAIAVALPVTVLLSGLLGLELLLLSMAAFAVMQLGLTWEGGGGSVTPEWDASIAVALPWLAGHLAFGPPTLSSALLALFFALAYAAPWRSRSLGGRVLLVGAHLSASVLLIGRQQPLAGGVVLLLLTPQLALLPWLRRGQPEVWCARYSRPWLLAAMLIAAWAL